MSVPLPGLHACCQHSTAITPSSSKDAGELRMDREGVFALGSDHGNAVAWIGNAGGTGTGGTELGAPARLREFSAVTAGPRSTRRSESIAAYPPPAKGNRTKWLRSRCQLPEEERRRRTNARIRRTGPVREPAARGAGISRRLRPGLLPGWTGALRSAAMTTVRRASSCGSTSGASIRRFPSGSPRPRSARQIRG